MRCLRFHANLPGTHDRRIGRSDEIGQAYQRDSQSNQIDIFGLLGAPQRSEKPGDVYPELKNGLSQESLAFEKEALGFYITGHPLDKYDRVIKKSPAERSRS